MGGTRLPARLATQEDTDERSLWESYLKRLAEPEGPLSVERAEEIRALWAALDKKVGLAMRPPHAGPMEDNGFAMSWDNGRHHFEIEVTADGTYGWFYMDRDSDSRHGEEDQPLGAISPGMISQLRRTLAA